MIVSLCFPSLLRPLFLPILKNIKDWDVEFLFMLFSFGRKSRNFLLRFCRGKRNFIATSLSSLFFSFVLFPFFWLMNISWYDCRLRAPGRPFIAFDPGMTRESLTYHGCAELFQVYDQPVITSSYSSSAYHIWAMMAMNSFLGCTYRTYSTQTIMDDKTWDCQGEAFSQLSWRKTKRLLSFNASGGKKIFLNFR